LVGKRVFAYEILIVFGKIQDIDFKKDPIAHLEQSLILYINPSNIFVHSKYRGDHMSGYDIALIGLEKDDYRRIENYIYKNQERLSENERLSKQYFFKENNLFQVFYNNDLDEDSNY
jgi:hypothetical protein